MIVFAGVVMPLRLELIVKVALMTNTSDDIAFLRAQVERGNDGSFFVLLYDFCYFDKKIFKKILKICLETEIEDKNLRQSFGKNARKIVQEKFSIEKMIADTEKMYENL